MKSCELRFNRPQSNTKYGSQSFTKTARSSSGTYINGLFVRAAMLPNLFLGIREIMIWQLRPTKECWNFIDIIADNRIFLPDPVCELVDKFETNLRRSVINVDVFFTRTNDYTILSPENHQVRNKVMMEAAEFIESKSDGMLKELVKEFRILLGDPQLPSSTAPNH